MIIVENVPAVTFDVRKSVQRTVKKLKKIGYTVGQGVVDLRNVGVPQKRRRHVVVALLGTGVDIQSDNRRVEGADMRTSPKKRAMGNWRPSRCAAVQNV